MDDCLVYLCYYMVRGGQAGQVNPLLTGLCPPLLLLQLDSHIDIWASRGVHPSHLLIISTPLVLLYRD